jgi:hypothetical protein
MFSVYFGPKERSFVNNLVECKALLIPLLQSCITTRYINVHVFHHTANDLLNVSASALHLDIHVPVYTSHFSQLIKTSELHHNYRL